MKKLLFALVLSTSLAAHAQITPEQRYAQIITPGKLSTGDVKYAGYVSLTPATGQVRIYNLNHSIYRQVPVTVPSGARIDGIQYLSDRLFNTNANLEFVLNLSNLSTTVYSATRVFDETGAQLFAADTAAYPIIYNTPSGTKMLLNYYTAGRARVFGLGGTLTALRVTPQASADQAQPYPNPAQQEIRLPYAVAPGQVAQLVVRDVAGRQVASYQVDNAFDYLSLDTRAMQPGVYFYTVGAGTAQRFVVQ